MEIHILSPKIPKDPESDLSQSLGHFSTAAEELGHKLTIIETKQCKMLFNCKPRILVNNQKPKIKVLIIRASFPGKDIEVHGTLIRQFELTGVVTVNNFQGIVSTKNKIRTLQLLSAAKVPMPKSYVVNSAEYVSEIMHDIGRFPVIIKSVYGSKGVGVAIAETKRGLRSVVDMMTNDDQSGPLILQEYIRESSGRDIRVIVVGGKIIAAMERIAKTKGEFRSNFSMGGKVKMAELTEAEKKIAIKATKACSLDFSGVDIIRSNEGPRVLEVNSNPGLSGITQATGVNVAGAIIKYAIKKLREKSQP